MKYKIYTSTLVVSLRNIDMWLVLVSTSSCMLFGRVDCLSVFVLSARQRLFVTLDTRIQSLVFNVLNVSMIFTPLNMRLRSL